MFAALLAAALLAAPPTTSPAPGADDRFTDADLAPLFPAGELARAAEDLDRGRAGEAARALRKSQIPAARYLAAVSLLQSGSPADALPLLAGLEERLPEVSDRVLFRRGQALDAAGRRREAAAALAQVPEGSLLWEEARLGQARALHASGEDDGALAALLPLLALADGAPSRGPATAEALLLAGRIRSKSGGDAAFARRAFIQCWAAHPLTATADDCLKALRDLPKDQRAPPGPADVVRRAEALLDENRNRAALQELEKVVRKLGAPSPQAALACRGRFALGKAYRKEREHAKAIVELAPVVESCDDPSLRARALYVLASSSSVVAPSDGLDRYRQLAREHPAHGFADDALFYAADILARDGRLEEARATLLELAERYPQGDFRAEALFRAAWISYRLGERDFAIATLSRIEELHGGDAYEHARAAYWRARLLDARAGEGDGAAAQAIWASIVDRYPADWYGLLGRARLRERGAGPLAVAPERLLEATAPPGGFRYRAGPLRGDRHFRAAVLLLRMGQRGAAADELAAVDRQAIAATDDLDPVLLLAELLDRAGDHQRAHHLVRTGGRAVLRGAPQPETLRVWRIAYPPAFRAEIERFAGPAGVEPDLLQALVREESALDPRVVSSAGAIGLTQLMVPTAQEVAKKLKLRKPRAADLMEPSLNIRLGASYLGQLLRRFGGSEPLAIAAYNVGGTPVRRWVKERGTLPLDEFVEEIPVQETRGYVKRVLRSFAAYRLLYGARTDAPLVLGQAIPRVE